MRPLLDKSAIYGLEGVTDSEEPATSTYKSAIYGLEGVPDSEEPTTSTFCINL